MCCILFIYISCKHFNLGLYCFSPESLLIGIFDFWFMIFLLKYLDVLYLHHLIIVLIIGKRNTLPRRRCLCTNLVTKLSHSFTADINF